MTLQLQLNFLIYEENLIFFFISVRLALTHSYRYSLGISNSRGNSEKIINPQNPYLKKTYRREKKQSKNTVAPTFVGLIFIHDVNLFIPYLKYHAYSILKVPKCEIFDLFDS
jgi:hypothetical protein